MGADEKKALEELSKRYKFFNKNPLATYIWLSLDIHNLGVILNLVERLNKHISFYEKNESYKAK